MGINSNNDGGNKQQSGGSSGQQQRKDSDKVKEKVQDAVEKIHRQPSKN